jgi:hypothetical protein
MFYALSGFLEFERNFTNLCGIVLGRSVRFGEGQRFGGSMSDLWVLFLALLMSGAYGLLCMIVSKGAQNELLANQPFPMI